MRKLKRGNGIRETRRETYLMPTLFLSKFISSSLSETDVNPELGNSVFASAKRTE